MIRPFGVRPARAAGELLQMSAPVSVGDVLAGKYQVERVLGVGGMGVVVAAKHLTLGERVAIKFLLPQALAREDVVTRFRREGQAAARLKSEHITRVHDVGQLETGQPFLVMEYLDGTDLGALVRAKGPLAIPDAVDYVLQACEALADAHSIGIVHRDLKPSNLFVIKRLDGSPCIKLIDFGISKITDASAEGAAGEMTATAVMMGSPLYMAPEQMASARDVDGRADIWSLGILLHTVLTGQPPFRAPTVMGVYEQIVAGAPPVRKQRAEVPEGLEAVILKCLKKDRNARYADVGELAEALAPFGPEHGVAAAARIKRIIVARRGTSVPPPPDLPLPVATITPAPSPLDPASKSAASLGGSASQIATKSGAERTPISDTQPSATSSAVDGPGTAGPWDQRTPPPSTQGTRGPSRAVLLAGAAVLMGAAAITFFAMRSGTTAPPAPAISAAPAAASSIAPAEPVPSVSPSGPASALPPASASAPPPASASAPVASAPSARTFAPLPGGARPRLPKAKSGDDLFGTQK
jgi:serine/threonine-protein kinase